MRPLIPADRLFLDQRIGGRIEQRRLVHHLEHRACHGEAPLDFFLRECRAKIGALHLVERVGERARRALVQVIGCKCGAERAAGVAGRGLDPDILKAAVAHDLAVGHAIERDPAGEAEVLRAGLLGDPAG